MVYAYIIYKIHVLSTKVKSICYTSIQIIYKQNISFFTLTLLFISKRNFFYLSFIITTNLRIVVRFDLVFLLFAKLIIMGYFSMDLCLMIINQPSFIVVVDKDIK